jgi:hypothetical protein
MGLVPDFRFILKEEQAVNMRLQKFYQTLSCASGTCVDAIHR